MKNKCRDFCIMNIGIIDSASVASLLAVLWRCGLAPLAKARGRYYSLHFVKV